MRSLLFTAVLIIYGQLSAQNWVDISNTLPSAAQDADRFEIQILTNGKAYCIYNKMTSAQVIKVMEYTPGGSWSSISTINTSSTTSVYKRLTSTIVNDVVYFWFENDSSTDQMALYSITDGVVASEGMTINGIDTGSEFGLQADPFNGDLYAYYDTSGLSKVLKFNFNTDSWGNNILNLAGAGQHKQLYIASDSIYYSRSVFNGSDYEVEVFSSSKIAPYFSVFTGSSASYQPGNTAHSTTGDHLLFGDLNSERSLVASNFGTFYDIPLTNGYVTGQVLPFDPGTDYDHVNAFNASDIVYMDAGTIKVMRKNYPLNTFTQLGADLETNPNAQNLHIARAPDGMHTLVAYRDMSSPPYPFRLYLSNNAPTVSTQTPAAQNCSEVSSDYLYNSLIIEDLDMDSIFLVNISSSNTSVLDPSGIYVDYFYSGTSIEVYVYADIGAVTVPTDVTLQFTFTDNADILTFSDVFHIVPSVIPQYILPLDFCETDYEVSLYDFVDLPGGMFSINETLIDPNFDPSAYFNNPGDVTILSLDYLPDAAVCAQSANATINIFASPQISVLQEVDASSCAASDGVLEASVTPGQSSNYSYQWSNNVSTTLFQNTLTPGLYSLEVIDDNGCKAKEVMQVGIDNVSLSATVTDNLCNDAYDGTITVDAVNGMLAPYSYFWSNGQSVNSATNLHAGTYFVTVTDGNGCQYSEQFSVAEPAPLDGYLYAYWADCGQSNGSLDLTMAGGTAPYTFLWNTSDVTEDLAAVPYGYYEVTVSDANGCETTRTAVVSEFGAPYLDIAANKTDCNADNGALDLSVSLSSGETSVTYSWSNTETTEDIANLAPGYYYVDVLSDLGCHGMAGATIATKAPAKNDVCVVTVDGITTTNLVVWEKPVTNDVYKYTIYRESAVAGQYLLIDSVFYDEISVFNDVVISPLTNSWRYRLGVVNECQVESPLSFHHRTIHLTTEDLGGGQFKVSWNKYEGTAYTSFILSRYTDADGWVEVTTLPTAVNTYTDFPPSVSGLDYRVDIELDVPCHATEGKAEDYNYIRSNRGKGSFTPGLGTGDPNNSVQEVSQEDVSVMMYPNPVSAILNIELTGAARTNIVVFDAAGREVMHFELSEGVNQLDCSMLDEGMYTIRITDFNYSKRLRFSKR